MYIFQISYGDRQTLRVRAWYPVSVALARFYLEAWRGEKGAAIHSIALVR